MKIIPIKAFVDNYIWMGITDNDAFCVDPGSSIEVINYLQKNNLTLRAILLTHHHADHIGGVSELLQFSPKISVYAPQDIRIPYTTHPVSDNESFSLLACNFEVISIPGHTSSHICYFETNNKWLFCGDTLFSAGCGRVFDGTYIDLFNSLNKLKTLPDNTQIYCGHEYTRKNLQFVSLVEPSNTEVSNLLKIIDKNPLQCTLPSTVKLEKEINPFLRTNCKEVRQFALNNGCLTEDEFSIFKKIREYKNNF